MITVIAEKHDIAKAITEALGANPHREDGYYVIDDYCITYCVGHLLNITIPNENEVWKWDNLPISTNGWKFDIKDDTKKQYSVIASLISKSDTIIHAGDPDDEGQLIVDEILYNEGIIDLKGNATKTIQRILINDNNASVIKKEFKKLKDNNDYLGLSLVALSRKLADITFGYNLTRAFTLKNQAIGNQGVVSVGRVQTPMLGLIVRRDDEVKNHIKSAYYEIIADIMIRASPRSSEEGYSFKFKYKNKNDDVDDKGNIVSEDIAKEIVARVNTNLSKGIFKDYTVEKEETPPPLPYNLLNLQIDCSKYLKIKPDRVLEITQNLREKYKAITYNRSDCQYLSDETFNDARKLLQNLRLMVDSGVNDELLDVLNQVDPDVKSRAFNSKKISAHTAIIPTDAVVPFLALTKDEQNVYLMIAKRFALQFLPNAISEKYTVTVDILGDEFISITRKYISHGWKNAFNEEKDDENNDNVETIHFGLIYHSCLKEIKGQSLNHEDTTIKLLTKETQPKKLYTTATFLSDLKRVANYCKNDKIKKLLKDKDKNIAGEQGGIGTPATRSSIIKTLYTRGYIEDNPKGNIISTKLGKDLIASLPENITYPDMTALWHEILKDVQISAKSVDDFVESVFLFTKNEVDAVKDKKISFDTNATKCPQCEGFLNKKKGNSGVFWGCSNYPDCKATFADKKGSPDLWQPIQCPECKKGKLHKFKGKENSFWKCQNEDCSKTFSDEKGKPNFKPKAAASEKFRCLECNSKLIRREGKFGYFWGCSNYPKCKTIYHDKKGEPIYQK